MPLRTTAFIGILVGILFVAGFSILFSVNQAAYEEMNNLSIARYNVVGMEYRVALALTTYAVSGLFAAFFCVGLILNKSGGLVGKIALLLAALVWASFAFFPFDIDDQTTHKFLLDRILVFLLTSFLGLLLTPFDYRPIMTVPLLKWYTVGSALAICIISVLSILSFTDALWIRLNISIVVYFAWYPVVGTALLLTMRKKNAA